MSAETDEIHACFLVLLNAATGDGAAKRDAGTKTFWKVDTTHKDAMLRHLGRWWNGEKVDAESGGHPLAHLAWRALAVAYQETHTVPEIPGQAEFWNDVKAGYLDRAPCYTKMADEGYKNWDTDRRYVEPAAKGHTPC